MTTTQRVYINRRSNSFEFQIRGLGTWKWAEESSGHCEDVALYFGGAVQWRHQEAEDLQGCSWCQRIELSLSIMITTMENM
ncbi:hypothetical protein COP1_030064 [Malus domestica]